MTASGVHGRHWQSSGVLLLFLLVSQKLAAWQLLSQVRAAWQLQEHQADPHQEAPAVRHPGWGAEKKSGTLIHAVVVRAGAMVALRVRATAMEVLVLAASVAVTEAVTVDAMVVLVLAASVAGKEAATVDATLGTPRTRALAEPVVEKEAAMAVATLSAHQMSTRKLALAEPVVEKEAAMMAVTLSAPRPPGLPGQHAQLQEDQLFRGAETQQLEVPVSRCGDALAQETKLLAEQLAEQEMRPEEATLETPPEGAVPERQPEEAAPEMQPVGAAPEMRSAGVVLGMLSVQATPPARLHSAGSQELQLLLPRVLLRMKANCK